jgi:hypothetical protein
VNGTNYKTTALAIFIEPSTQQFKEALSVVYMAEYN